MAKYNAQNYQYLNTTKLLEFNHHLAKENKKLINHM